MSAPSPSLHVLHQVVGLAGRAPSMYNAQPWAWRADGGHLELYADRSRSLPVADPLGRNLVIGCGAALHHAETAAAAFGWALHAERLPDEGRPDLLATLTCSATQVTREESRLLEALQTRRTDRRRFGSWPVPPERLARLAASARVRGAVAVPVTDEAQRQRVEELVSHALNLAAQDDRLMDEQRVWLDRGREDGVPTETVPRLLGRTGSDRSRFGAGLLPQPDREPVISDGLIVLGSRTDEPADWLRVGEALSAAWLHAETTSLSIVPLTQVAELEETREALRDDVLEGLAVPHLLLRVGWLSPAREPLAATPRRPLADLLLL